MKIDIPFLPASPTAVSLALWDLFVHFVPFAPGGRAKFGLWTIHYVLRHEFERLWGDGVGAACRG